MAKQRREVGGGAIDVKGILMGDLSHRHFQTLRVYVGQIYFLVSQLSTNIFYFHAYKLKVRQIENQCKLMDGWMDVRVG